MDFELRLAGQADDADIRHLLAANPMPGPITLNYLREPDYFPGCATMGPFSQVLMARHRPDGALAGIMGRSSCPLFVNGREQEVGYYSQLRVDKKFQGRWLQLAPQGHRWLRSLHADGRVQGYIASIIEGNTKPVGLFVDRPRPGYPAVRPYCRLWTLAIIVRRPLAVTTDKIQVCRGTAGELPEIIEFLRRRGCEKQFFPCYTENDFCGSPRTRGFDVRDFLLARRSGKLAGIIGLWDQSSCKQIVIQRYSWPLGSLRRPFNLGLRLLGARPLPPPGEELRMAYASFVCMENNDARIFSLLLRHVHNLAAQRGYAYLMVGLAENDPLLAPARNLLHLSYKSILYTICWDDAAGWHSALDNRIPYIEVAAL